MWNEKKQGPNTEIWAKKKKEPWGRLYTKTQMLRGDYGTLGNKAELRYYLRREATEVCDLTPLCCDWCGKPRHDDDCEVDE